MHTGSEGPCPLIQFGISKRAGGCLDLLLVFTSGPHVSPDHLCFTSERDASEPSADFYSMQAK